MPTWRKLNIALFGSVAGMAMIDVFVAEVPAILFVGVIVLYGGWVVYGSLTLSASLFLSADCAGPTSKRRIALTFDDGPVQGKTNRILDILDKHDVRASFFCIGSRIPGNEGLLSRIDQSGHTIGNHTYFHKVSFGFLSSARVVDELIAANEEIFRVTGKRPSYFRPPFGVSNPLVARAVAATGLRVIGWSVRSFDTIIRDPQRLLARIVRSVSPGGIILLHDYCESTISILPALIAELRRRNYEFVTLEELLNQQGYA